VVNYRRNWLPGDIFFFTVTLADRRARWLVTRIELLRAAVRIVRHQHPFVIEAIVVLPDHLHALWTLPPGDADFAGRWKAIKRNFTHALVQQGVPLIPNAKGEYRLWQRRYWEHTIRDEDDWQRHVEYIHYNPVKHGLVTRVAAWPFSSFHHFVRLGWLSPDWGGGEERDNEAGFGE
jgi:putative transposase